MLQFEIQVFYMDLMIVMNFFLCNVTIKNCSSAFFERICGNGGIAPLTSNLNPRCR